MAKGGIASPPVSEEERGRRGALSHFSCLVPPAKEEGRPFHSFPSFLAPTGERREEAIKETHFVTQKHDSNSKVSIQTKFCLVHAS